MFLQLFYTAIIFNISENVPQKPLTMYHFRKKYA